MNTDTATPLTLTRDVVGVLIPQGTRVELPEGAQARLTQALGGSFTVQVEGHLFRIDGKDADSLGLPPPERPEIPENATDKEIETAAWAQMRTCFDPEIPVNIVDLGLIYECRIEPLDDGGRRAVVKMTLTAPGCGMGDILVNDVKTKVSQLPTVNETDVELVFDPPWTQDMMSEEARLQTGMF
ncbi:putative Fe-S cluster assembly protein SufT [Flagellatimonas centrodinii]|uniref:putative Fe-S cluster assembly protein SufT n=1 Tax=Flagellatimonas centrodinii TaxID=2806210 RepID=UPI001FEE0028|nr:putative Fe-S cluster assembly protein SufT [Flagellatimonas centrodinii]ULQ47873.1 putative Fe-S cluster assembly protein SufT [Flagellatimonas centrodinii]